MSNEIKRYLIVTIVPSILLVKHSLTLNLSYYFASIQVTADSCSPNIIITYSHSFKTLEDNILGLPFILRPDYYRVILTRCKHTNKTIDASTNCFITPSPTILRF